MNAETVLVGGLPHWSKKDFAETVLHVARHALGQPVNFKKVELRCKLRYNDGRVDYEEFGFDMLDAEGKPPRYVMHKQTRFEHGHNRRTIDGRFIYDEVAS